MPLTPVHPAARLAPLLLIACGDDGRTKREPVPLSEARLELVSAYCRTLACSLDAIPRAFGADPTCVGYLLPLREGDYWAGLVGQAEAGILRYHGARFAGCLDHLDATCDLSAYGVCLGEAFDGPVDQGGPCGALEHCAGDSFCEADQICGTCEPFPTAGQACQFGFSCGNDGDLECIEGTCVAVKTMRVGLGEPCAFGSIPIGTRAKCPAGSWCREGDFGDGRPSQCIAFVEEGVACQDGFDRCIPEAICIAGPGAPVCRRIEIVSTAGAPCDGIRICNFMARLECVDARCWNFGDGGEGSRCFGSGFLPDTCLAGTTCGPSSTCVAVLPECSDDSSCGGEAGRCIDGRCYFGNSCD